MNITNVDLSNCNQIKYTNSLYQYDYGQYLKITGIELPYTFQAHFCNVGDTQTITQIGQDGQVSIPDELLLNSKGITCYIYLHTGENDGETEYRINIPVNQRPAPSDEEPTPVQQSAIDQAIAALNNGVTLAEGFAEQAEEYSVVAQQASANAEESEANAKTSEDNAKLSEENASQSELNAKASEENARTSEVNAKASEIEAGLSADDALRYAERAEQAATTAGYLDVEINEDGHLIYIRTDQVDVDFSLENGHLIMEAV